MTREMRGQGQVSRDAELEMRRVSDERDIQARVTPRHQTQNTRDCGDAGLTSEMGY